jgi:hypothetical protein
MSGVAGEQEVSKTGVVAGTALPPDTGGLADVAEIRC